MGGPHIVLYGHFGVGNLGNDTTLEAVLYNIRRFQPEATITCVCRGPQVIAQRFGIATVPVDVHEDRTPGEAAVHSPTLITRLVTRALDEADFWVRRTHWFRSIDQLMVIGTGAIYDGTAPPWNMPYDLFKWCRAAKLGGAKVIFLSIGAGPVNHPASRFLMLNALRGAHYRSYRDRASFDFLHRVGFDTTGDQLYPDLVFSLPVHAAASSYAAPSEPLRVGLGVIGYYGPSHDTVHGEPIYQAYVDKLKQFVQWLLGRGHHVRLLTGDLENDRRPADEVVAFVHAHGSPGWRACVVAEPIATVQDLSQQIEQTDVVIASRFHNLIGAMMLGRPTISVGFHEKNDSLMADMGLHDYCQHIEQLSVERLIAQFCTLAAEFDTIAQRIHQKQAEYRQRLDEQYRTLLSPQSAPVPVSIGQLQRR